jgi:DNA-binding GntR family transcriptional regulator
MEIESVVDQARRHIQEWIVTGQFKPGQKIKEEEIARRLNISRPPVREAFKMLEAEGFIVRKPRRGVFVTEMTDKDIWEIYTLKAALYETATLLAMEVISDSEISKLESHVKDMELCVAEKPADLLRYQTLHRSFHNTITTISGNDRLKRIAATLHNQVSRFSFKSLQKNDHLQSSMRYHAKIVKAFKQRDKILASQLMKDHVLAALDVLVDRSDLKSTAKD